MRARRLGRRFVLPAFVVACACGWLTSVAAAEFGPIQLVSKSSKEQADFAEQPVMSADGRFVAFFGELGGRTGILRKDLATGAITLVAERQFTEQGVEDPSISADGRYVAFTTARSLVPEDDGEVEDKDVYIADLDTSPPTYELASSAEGHRLGGESSAAPGVALSADGSEVAFVNGGQVYVHVVGVEEPILISAKKDTAAPEPVVGGGAYQPAGAALSADGNAVAWVGEHLAEQVPLLHDEEEQIVKETYQEPLWRLVPSVVDPNPPTRRIVGGGDPLAPGCPPGGSLSESACQGPFPKLDENHIWGIYTEAGTAVGKGWGVNLPQLSADGGTVALVGSPDEINDLFVVDMSAGLSRVDAVKQLTKWVNPDPAALLETAITELKNAPYSGEIAECAISPDGSLVAFTTLRQIFAGGPTLATVRPTAPAATTELYQVNLDLRTIERVTPGPGTGISLGVGSAEGARSLSYDGDGRLLAFADGAENLVTGDANERSDVFMVESTPPGPVEPSKISPPPSRLSAIPSWRLSAHAVSRPDGDVRIIATVPGPGTLRVSATSPLGPQLRSQIVDTTQRRSPSGGGLRLELKLPRRLRTLAHRKGGLYAWLDLRFSGTGGNPLRQQFAARFRAHHPKSKKKGRGK